MDENKKIWQECKKEIKKSVSFQAYQTWFSDLQFMSADFEQITLQVPNRFHYEWIENKYGQLINTSLKKFFGRELSVNYSILVKPEKADSTPEERAEKLIPNTFHRASRLNVRYTFTNFIEGKGNQFAKAAASSVADGPGQTPFNPLLVYSNPGLGNTHLIQAIGIHILNNH